MLRVLPALALLTALLASIAAGRGQSGQPAPPARITKKVLVLNFDPIVRSEGGRRLHAVCKWNDPRYLAAGYAADLHQASGGCVRYDVAEWKDVDAFPVKKDGYRYTEAEYLRCFRAGKGWHQPDAIDYHALIREFGLDRRVARGEIDEVWLMSMPYSGCYESTMAGRGAYECNSPPLEEVDCPRIFVIMGFNYERGVGEMLEDMGHRTEAIMTHVYGGWKNDTATAWDRFTRYDKEAPGEAACGNVHYAPNSLKDYDWGNPSYVQSACDDWLDYPHLTGRKRLVTASDWGNGYIRSHHVWWLTHLPKAPGRAPDGKLANWWAYNSDFNRYPESRGSNGRGRP